VVLGIPDFRLEGDPYLNREADRAKALRLAEEYDRLDLRGLVERYWSLTPDTPPEMARRFTEHTLAGRSRGEAWLAGRQPAGDVLEIGCRGGGLLVALAAGGARAVGIDMALRWLVVAKKALEEAGLTAGLCCCHGERLPFPPAAFDGVLAENVLEHSPDPGALLAGMHYALRPGGIGRGTTWNRFAPLPEPHVRLWGVGWLPRPWARRYVPWRGRGEYRVRLLSAPGTSRLLRSSPFGGGTVRPAPLSTAQLGQRARLPLAFYDAIRRTPLLRSLLLAAAPVLEWEVRRRRDTAA
jgi:SAM-dependent methyltransferase